MPRMSENSFQRNRELQHERNARSNPARKRHAGKLLSRIANLESREFVGWDGEGYNRFVSGSDGSTHVEHCYMLFGSSSGYAVSGPNLSTRECLDTVLAAESANPDAIHCGFAFEYDVNMILRDLEWRYLAMLYDTGQTIWNGYRLKHTPGKMFSVSRKNVGHACIYNVFGFFHSSYIRALHKYNIGTPEQRDRIAAGKSRRSYFSFGQLPDVEKYWSEEISLLPPLMESLREAAYGASFFITEWHGPGALASYALKDNHASTFKAKNVPTPVKIARQYAYAGGRFQSWKAGLYEGDIYTADINSAYAYAASLCPRLDRGRWIRRSVSNITSSGDIARFGLYRIRLDCGPRSTHYAREKGIPFPLFNRGKQGHLAWPAVTEGWYWSPEAATVAGSPHAQFLEAWEFEDDGTYPFDWIKGGYDRRLQLQAIGHPAEKAYKWMLAAMYGQWAQRVGWDKERRRAPRSHQIEWAGFITSMCRALVYRAAMSISGPGSRGLVSIDTDGVCSTAPFDENALPGGVGTHLGGWKLEHFSGILYWQNGIYWLRNEETPDDKEAPFGREKDGTPRPEWVEPKTRGIPRGSIDIRTALAALDANPARPVFQIQRQHFIGYGQALQHRYEEWRNWKPTTTEVVFGGSGKGMHVPDMCPKCKGSSNPMHTITHFPPLDPYSQPHKLPWLIPEKEPEQNVTEMIWRHE